MPATGATSVTWPAVTLARVLGAIGRTLIAAGVLLLAFVAYQLWGTGLHTARAQADLERQFEQQLAETTTTTSTTAPVAPTTSIEVGPADPAGLAPPAKGDPLGRIVIDRIGVDFIFVEGVDLLYLQDGPGHFPSTPFPGQPGNAALAGHRTTYLAPFHRLDELQPGDPVEITTVQGTFRYEVLPQAGDAPGAPPSGHRIVAPDALEILDDKGDDRLTLMACHPKYSAAQRIVVEAVMVGPPAAPTPQAEPAEVDLPEVALDSLAGNDPSARGPAVAWSLAAGAVWLAAWLVARRWRAWRSGWWWLTYGLALVPFTVLLYAAFENIAKLLPAAY